MTGASTLTFTQTAAASSAVAGGTVSYTITIANTGTSVYAGASFTDPLGGVLDDATWNDDAVASGGTLTFASPVLSWSGDVPASGTDHHHLFGHRAQPRHREHDPGQHHHLPVRGQQLPGRQPRPPVHRDGRRSPS